MFLFYLLLISVELITSKCNTFFNTICFFNEMPFGVPTFLGFFSLGSSTAADTFQVHCAIN